MLPGVVYYSHRGQENKQQEEMKMKQYVKVIATQEIVEVYFRHADGIAYVGEHGVKILFEGQYEEMN